LKSTEHGAWGMEHGARGTGHGVTPKEGASGKNDPVNHFSEQTDSAVGAWSGELRRSDIMITFQKKYFGNILSFKRMLKLYCIIGCDCKY